MIAFPHALARPFVFFVAIVIDLLFLLLEKWMSVVKLWMVHLFKWIISKTIIKIT